MGQINSSEQNTPILKGLLEVQSPQSDQYFSSFKNIRRSVTAQIEIRPQSLVNERKATAESPIRGGSQESRNFGGLRLVRRNLNSTVKDLESQLNAQQNLKKKIEEAEMFFSQYNRIVKDCTEILNKKENIIDLSSFTEDPIRKLLLSEEHLKLKLALIKEKLMKLSQQYQLSDKKYKALAIVTGITQLGQRANVKKYGKPDSSREFRKRAFFFLNKEIKMHISKLEKERKELNSDLLLVEQQRNARIRKKLSIVKSTLYL